jgi:hypothetical protein
MIVFVDANVIIGDPSLNLEEWQQLRSAVAAGRVIVTVPEIAIEEAIAKRRQNIRAIGRKLVEEAKWAPREVKDIVRNAHRESLILAENFDETFRRSWASHGFQITPTANPDHLDVARRAIHRERPFNDQGNGYRDTLHWLSLLEMARKSPHERFVFVSGDGIFADKQNRLQMELTNEFQKVSSASVVLCRKLSELEIPGHYTSPPADSPQFEDALRNRLLEELAMEHALRRIRTVGVSIPAADWEDLQGVFDLHFLTITSRNVENQLAPELQFTATATFLIRGTYLSDNDDLDAPEIFTHDVEMPVQISGVAEARTGDEVGLLRSLNAVLLGDDLNLREELRKTGRRNPGIGNRDELEEVFGHAAVARAERELFGPTS